MTVANGPARVMTLPDERAACFGIRQQLLICLYQFRVSRIRLYTEDHHVISSQPVSNYVFYRQSSDVIPRCSIALCT